jgi:hypothetical protein
MDVIHKLRTSGLEPIATADIPIRLKRNERLYFLGGTATADQFLIRLAITSNRVFYVQSTQPAGLRVGNKKRCAIGPGIRSLQLTSVIAIDTPEFNRVVLHVEGGRAISIALANHDIASLFYAVLTETVDQSNNPIDETALSPTRERIPDEVKLAVWRRDQASCVRCGSRERLEYDHIIPVVKGGSNTARNIELLCENCNRSKSARIM